MRGKRLCAQADSHASSDHGLLPCELANIFDEYSHLVVSKQPK
jgi:hypothetical protein